LRESDLAIRKVASEKLLQQRKTPAQNQHFLAKYEAKRGANGCES
jgi:hypothetical protein